VTGQHNFGSILRYLATPFQLKRSHEDDPACCTSINKYLKYLLVAYFKDLSRHLLGESVENYEPP
jgi:hypothetical protein